MKTGIILLLLTCLTGGIAALVWSFVYNKHYTQNLIRQGYVFAGSEGENALAKQKLAIV